MALVPSVCSRIGHSAQTVHAGALCSSSFVQRYLVCHIGLHCIFLAALSSKSYTQCLTIRPSGRLLRRLTQALGTYGKPTKYSCTRRLKAVCFTPCHTRLVRRTRPYALAPWCRAHGVRV